MHLITHLDQLPQLTQPCAITIGTFDGVHLGHQRLLRQLRKPIGTDGISVVFTFSNHPSALFSPQAPVPLIYPPLQKVQHLFDCGVDLVVLIPFDKHFAAQDFKAFLHLLKQRLGFQWLVLGEGATFGKDKLGTSTAVKALSQTMDFEVDYLPKLELEHSHHSICISSRHIRTLIQQGSLTLAAQCLGRPYSLLGHCTESQGRIFCAFPGICLPPEGQYEVEVVKESGDCSLGRVLGVATISHTNPGLYLDLDSLSLDAWIHHNIRITFIIYINAPS